MKGIIAAFEAKRAAHRSEAMSSFCASAAIAASALVAFAAGTAVAQQDVRWTDPSRTWSMDFVSSDWGHAEGLPRDAGVFLLTMPIIAPPDAQTRLCFVEQHYAALARGEDAAAVRARAGEMSVAQAENAFPRAHLRETRVTFTNVDGVTVAAVEGVSGASRFRGRIFVTAAPDRQVLSTITCLSAPNMPAERDAEIDTILGTIRFHSTDAAK